MAFERQGCSRPRKRTFGSLGALCEASKEQSDGKIPIDTSNMQLVIDKFMVRLCDSTIDVDVRVQGVAMELLLVLLRENFLDSLDEDKFVKINLRKLHQKPLLLSDTTPFSLSLNN